LAAAWFYKKTLATLQHAENSSHSQDFQIPEEDPDDTA
jgi:hypothetical protein